MKSPIYFGNITKQFNLQMLRRHVARMSDDDRVSNTGPATEQEAQCGERLFHRVLD